MMAVDAWPSPEVPYILKRTSRDKYQTLDMDFSPPPPPRKRGRGFEGFEWHGQCAGGWDGGDTAGTNDRRKGLVLGQW